MGSPRTPCCARSTGRVWKRRRGPRACPSTARATTGATLARTGPCFRLKPPLFRPQCRSAVPWGRRVRCARRRGVRESLAGFARKDARLRDARVRLGPRPAAPARSAEVIELAFRRGATAPPFPALRSTPSARRLEMPRQDLRRAPKAERLPAEGVALRRVILIAGALAVAALVGAVLFKVLGREGLT